MFCLNDGILSGGCIEYEQGFVGGTGQCSGDDAADFFDFFHEVDFGVQAACCVDDYDVYVACSGCLNGVECHRCCVCTRLVAHHVRPCAVGPDAELVNGCCPKCVSRGEEYFFSFAAEFVGHFANGGGFARAVDAYDEDDVGFGCDCDRWHGI